MAFDPENDLERLLMRAAREPAARETFSRALLDSEIYLALFGDDPERPLVAPGSDTLPKDLRLRLVPIEHEGRTLLPFFSAPSRIRAVTGADHVAAKESCKTFFENNPNRGFLLNPGSDYGKEFLPEEVARLSAGDFDESFSTVQIPEGTQLFIGEPADYPHAFVDALEKALRDKPEIRAAYLLQAVIGRGEPSLLLDILSTTSREAASQALRPLIERLKPAGRMIDVHIAETTNDLFASGTAKPFYQASAPESPSLWRRLFRFH